MSLKLTEKEVEDLLEEEWYIVRNSGENPEIALHSSIYYLTRGQEGPSIEISNAQVAVLQKAAADQFVDIVFRDTDIKNIGTSVYRGLERTIVNYRRYLKFCERQDLANDIVGNLCPRLHALLSQEIHLLTNEDRALMLNCSFETLKTFLDDLSGYSENMVSLTEGVSGYFS